MYRYVYIYIYINMYMHILIICVYTTLNEVTQTAGRSTTQFFPGTALNYLSKLSSSFGTLAGVGSPKFCKHVACL